MLAALEAGLFYVNQQSNSSKLQLVSRVLEVSRQVVAGLKYVIRVEMGESECENSNDGSVPTDHIASTGHTIEDCPIVNANIHELTIWDKPSGTERYQLLSNSVVVDLELPPEMPEVPAEPETMDGPQTVQATDDAVVAALMAGMALLNAESGDPMLYQPVRVVEATQVVAEGLIYTLLVELGLSECSNTGQVRPIEDCPVAGETIFRKLIVLDQPWQPEASRYSLGNHPLKTEALEAPTEAEEDDDNDKGNSAESRADRNYAADEVMVYAVGIALGAAALVLVPAAAWWYFKVHKPSHHDGAVLVMTEEPTAHDQL
jgi:hypothetical protein